MTKILKKVRPDLTLNKSQEGFELFQFAIASVQLGTSELSTGTLQIIVRMNQTFEGLTKYSLHKHYNTFPPTKDASNLYLTFLPFH